MSRAFRYYLIVSLAALGTSLAAVAGWRFARASAPVNGPIVLITLEGISAIQLPLYGNRGLVTPALDALASDGVVFERAYAHVPLTLPAHVALLSGRLPHETGVRDNIGDVVPPSARLVSSMLADRGYTTGGVVSSFALRADTGLASGFTFFDDELNEHQPDDDTSDEAPPPTVARSAEESAQRAERWLSAAGTTRAFLFLHVSSPFDEVLPDEVPGRFARRNPDERDVAQADAIVGRLVAYLKKQQLYDQSTLVVTSAHGESAGQRGQHATSLVAFDRGTHVPLIIKQAGSDGAGRRVANLAQHVDIVPTILDFAKAPAPSGLAGRSLRPMLDGHDVTGRLAFAESQFPARHYDWPSLGMVTDGRFQYVKGATAALFDLDDEPALRLDVSDKHPDVVARLARALDEWADDGDVSGLSASKLPLDERDKFLALGLLGPRSIAGEGEAGLRASASADRAVPDALTPDQGRTLVEAYDAAMRAVAHHRWTVAIEHLRALTKQHPTRADTWASLGVVADRAGQPDVAIDAYRRALASEPSRHGTRLRLSSALMRTRRLDEARSQALLVTDAEDPALQARAHELLARIAVLKHEPGTARVHAQHVLEVDPASAVPAVIEGRLLFDRGRFDEALEWLDKASSQAKGAPVLDLQLWRAETLLELDRQAEAEDSLLDELRLFPESTRPYAALATLYHAQDRHNEIAPVLARMTRRMQTPNAYDIAARLWTDFGDRTRAEAARARSRALLSANRANINSTQ